METLFYDETRRLALDLYLPRNAPQPPLFIYMHGGGLEAGSRQSCVSHWKTLAEEGVACASLDYRLYPDARFPDYIEDCARAIAFLLARGSFGRVVVGGSSAGAYLAMMLFFDPHYLADAGVDVGRVGGWMMDAGQPTVHFNVLRERGLDTRLVRVDEAAPLYFLDHNFSADAPDVVLIAASQDMYARLEQLRLLERTMLHFRFPREKLRFVYMDGYKHCGYTDGAPMLEVIRSMFPR